MASQQTDRSRAARPPLPVEHTSRKNENETSTVTNPNAKTSNLQEKTLQASQRTRTRRRLSSKFNKHRPSSPISSPTVIVSSAQRIPPTSPSRHSESSTPAPLRPPDDIVSRQPRTATKTHDTQHSMTERSAGDGSSKSDDEEREMEELAMLRCPSECTEVIAEREHRRLQRQRRCSDYPGLAFGSSVFSSDTLMKFSIIKNELHNILNSQLKRAEGEIAALNRRIQLLEEDLERSEERLSTATAKLAEASQAADESERIRKALENRSNMEDDRVSLLEAQLAQAKLIAEESDKKYEECRQLFN